MEWIWRLAGILKVKGSVEFKLSVPNCNNFVITFCVKLSHFFCHKAKKDRFMKKYVLGQMDTNKHLEELK